MKRILLLSLAMLFAGVGQAIAQRTVSGKVSSSVDGLGLPGATVRIKGTSQGVTTNFDGEFRIEVPGAESVLMISSVGFVTVEETVGNRSVIDVTLQEDVKQLSEVVVTGYGTRDKNAFTGSIASVSGESIQQLPVATVDQALQGNVAGLQLSSSSGTPGSTQDIRIRGISSITASNSPLFVIDGIPVVSGAAGADAGTGSLGVLSTLNSNDIESISVLKDASAAALYGARGSNGVIIITTKKGKSGKPTVTLSAQRGTVDRAVEGPKMLNSAQLEELFYEGLANYMESSVQDARAYWETNVGEVWDGTTDTNWGDVVTNSEAITQKYDLSVRGGSDRSSYYGSFGYFQQDGVTIGSDFERYNGKLAFTQDLGEKVKFQTNFIGSHVVQNGQLEGAAYFGNPTMATLFMMPTDKAYNEDGSANLDLWSIAFNPVYVTQNDVNRKLLSRAFNSSSLEYKIIDDLKFTSELGLDYSVTEQLDYDNPNYGDGYNGPGENNGASYNYLTRNFNWVWRNMLDYSIMLGTDHKIDAKLAYEAQKNKYYFLGSGGVGLATEGLIYPSSVGTPDYASGYVNDWAINSIIGAINYSFKGNIFLDGTLRREGNSRFSPGNRWGTFYSVGASWVISDEAFMEGMSSWLSDTKIRASYGRTGNAGVDINSYQALLSFGGAYGGAAAAYPSQYGNTYLSWENGDALDVGLDFNLFNKVSGSVDYFHRTSIDLLLDVPLSRTTGFNSQWQNNGEMVNKGWEVTLNSNIVDGAFKWNLGVNLTSLENEVTMLPRNTEGDEIGIVSGTRRVTEGLPVWAWYMPTWAGVDTETGSPLWYVEGNSGETTSNYADAEASYQGSSALPTFYGGINNRFEFKGAYLSANLYYSTGNSVYDTWAGYTQSDGRYTYRVANAYARQYDRWQKPGDVSPNPKVVYGNTSQSNATSSRRLYDGEYARLRDVTLGYNLPKSLLENLGIANVNIYLKGTNVYTWVKDENLEFDPEVKSDGYLDLNAPPLKTYSVGLNVSF